MKLKTDKAAFAAEFIDLPMAAQIAGVSWEPFQLEYLNNTSRFTIDLKARQVAWSFTAALDAICDSIVNPGNPHIFVSMNQEEAKEKIWYANAIIEAIDAPVRPKLVGQGSTQRLEFVNGSRLISHPCKPPRGKAKSRIYLDEMAHYQEGLDRQIYTGATPGVVKGDGYLRIGSSPLGAKGLFWEIYTENLKKWPGFIRQAIPWWSVKSLCWDVKTALKLAPQLTTEERVYAFGRQPLIEIFENMFLEDFQQEYECAWVDESTAWITWEIIKRNQKTDLLWWHAKSVDEAIGMIEEIRQAGLDGLLEQSFTAGIDVGRKKNLTEFMMLGKGTSGQLPIRFSVSLDRIEYDDQERCFIEILNRLPITSCLIDQNGLGMMLAENLANRTRIAEGVDFTNQTKELWAVEARVQAERGNTPLPVDRDIAYQIHSIKKTVTAAKNNVFDTARNEKHHADKFWAWALALWGGTSGMVQSSQLLDMGTVEVESRWAQKGRA